MERPNTPETVDRHVAAHEVFLEFFCDTDAELWQEWWSGIGYELFESWASETVI